MNFGLLMSPPLILSSMVSFYQLTFLHLFPNISGLANIKQKVFILHFLNFQVLFHGVIIGSPTARFKWQSLSFGLSMSMLILLNHYMFSESMMYLHEISGLEANKMHFKTHCFVYKQS